MSSQRRFVVLDRWRGICAVLVAVFHFSTIGQVIQYDFIRHSWIFVDFFFVLSGFVITHTYADKLASLQDLAVFAVRRLGRIWPLHIFILGLFLVLVLVKEATLGSTADNPAASLQGLLSTVLFLHSTPLWPHPSLNGPSWSISVEYWTYILFGLTLVLASLPAFSRISRSTLLLALWLAALVALLVGPGRMETYAAYAIARCLFGFLGGCFAYGFWQRLQLLAPPKSGVLMGCVEIAAVGLIAVFVTVYAYTPLQFLSPLVFGSAILIFAFEAGMVSKLLSLRPFVLLGELSFSIYMTHSLLREVLRWGLTLLDRQAGIVLVRPAHLPPLSIPDPLVLTGGDMSVAALLLLFLTTTLLFSLLTRRMVEQPGQALFGRLANSMARRPAPLGFPVPDKAN